MKDWGRASKDEIETVALRWVSGGDEEAAVSCVRTRGGSQ